MNGYAQLYGRQVHNHSCGHTAMHNRSVSLWQSWMTRQGRRAEVPALINLEDFARRVRRGWTQ